MTEERRIGEFLEELFSKSPTPGGGGASALGGALGAALGGMVGSLTVGKKTYAAVENEVKGIMDRLHDLMEEMAKLADRDEEAFAPLAQCYRMPSATAAEREKKAAAMEEKLLAASLVPMEIMEKSVEALKLVEILAEKGSRMAVSDAGVAAHFLRAALGGASMNVYINTKAMEDRARARQLNARAGELKSQGFALADRVTESVAERLL